MERDHSDHPKGPHPDYPPDYPLPREKGEATPHELAAAATARRLEREEAFVKTTTVAGHDFRREHEDRERER